MDKPGQIHNLKLVYLWITDYIPKKKKEGGKEISKKQNREKDKENKKGQQDKSCVLSFKFARYWIC